MTQPAPQQQQQEIKINDPIPGGEYANFMQIGHTKEEFVLMFANVVGGSGRVVSKVITSPGHLKRIIAALQDNVQKYESQFGAVQEAAAPAGKEVGFQAE